MHFPSSMLVRSFALDHHQLVPVEVELTLWPGLPSIQFVGLPDQQIKESAWRIKSAIKAQGFEFPKARQILINLRPNNIKKSSEGIELAVAVAYLMETGQISSLSDELLRRRYFYGSLGLDGQVHTTTNLPFLSGLSDEEIEFLTGMGSFIPPFQNWSCLGISHLGDLKKELVFSKVTSCPKWERPKLDPNCHWTREEAEFLKRASVGGHHVLLAGPAGSGKTSLAKALHGLLPTPRHYHFRGPSWNGREPHWRALCEPHHSVTRRALLGGGSDLSEGELTRANGGILLLDEFLEFKHEVIESLREPLESGVIHLARGSRSQTLPAQVQLVATTNLCPCGHWSPGEPQRNCRFTLKRCRSYGERFSGPLLDRFQLLFFMNKRKANSVKHRDIPSEALLEPIEKALAFQSSREQQKGNSMLHWEDFRKNDQEILTSNLLPERIVSERRRLAILRVARTVADLKSHEKITPLDLQEGIQWAYVNFERLSQWD